jgi:hypothetical protein
MAIAGSSNPSAFTKSIKCPLVATVFSSYSSVATSGAYVDKKAVGCGDDLETAELDDFGL